MLQLVRSHAFPIILHDNLYVFSGISGSYYYFSLSGDSLGRVYQEVHQYLVDFSSLAFNLGNIPVLLNDFNPSLELVMEQVKCQVDRFMQVNPFKLTGFSAGKSAKVPYNGMDSFGSFFKIIYECPQVIDNKFVADFAP